MSVHFVVNCAIKDQALLDEYIAGAGASLGVVPLELGAMDNESEIIEGTPPGPRTVILKFASKDDFRTWYNSPEYQAVVGKRFDATEGFGVLVNGM